MPDDAGRLNKRLNPVNSNTANVIAVIAIRTIAVHWRLVSDLSRIRNFGAPLLVLKEFAELDERVEQGLRDLILVTGGSELAFLIGI